MLRFISHLFKLNYEVCQSCSTLKEQLEYERAEKAQLTQTLLNIINPKAIEAAPVIMQPVQQTGGLFARRRAALEERDRQEARILREKKNLGIPDKIGKDDSINSILKLEEELDIPISEKAEGAK